ncbi:hypothetical protein [Clostridium omnivorum]|uniref:Uncharacterized protein n=1 Tax=Clostridium omnivorum TaxID=1604902 RepID=A0ABQ5N8Y8_9CLOT|nr:hypothetical protein [Clostridium sp. E14]GLC31552.1 hypothetical protein bsdE14_29620 [Clostridium sp. E14]
MPKEKNFFATKADLINGLDAFEQLRPVKYVKCGVSDTKEILIYETIDEFINLGKNSTGDHQSESYLVLDYNVDLNLRQIKQMDGSVKYFVDQLMNKSSVVFWPGGIYDETYLICGHVATISDDPISLDLFKHFSMAITKGFEKVGRYYIGLEARKLSLKRRLITMNINQPVEYDLKL